MDSLEQVMHDNDDNLEEDLGNEALGSRIFDDKEQDLEKETSREAMEIVSNSSANSQVVPLGETNEVARIIDMDAVWHICTICRKAFLSQLQLTNHRVNAHGMPRVSRGTWVMSQFDLLPSIILKHCGSLVKIEPDDVFSDSEDIETESAIRVKKISSLVEDRTRFNKNSIIYQKPCPKSKKIVEIESAIRVKSINSLVEEHDSDNGSSRTYQKKSKKKAVHFNISNENRSNDVQTCFDDDGPTCKICSKTFKSSYYLEIHITSHSEDRPFPCENCGKSFKHIKAVRQHDAAVHKKENKMTNSTSTFGNENERKSKLPFHTSVPTEKNSQLVKKARPTCNTCGKEFRNNHDLSVHAASHSEERPFSCQDCEKTFKTTKALQQHRVTIHERELTWECKECPAKFGLKTELTYHSRIHLGIPLFESMEMGIVDPVDDNASIQKQATKQVGPEPGSRISFRGDVTNLLDSGLESLDLETEVVGANSQVVLLGGKNEEAAGIIDMDAVWHICTICRKAFLSQLQLTDHRVSAHGMPRVSRGSWVMSQFDLLPSILLKKCESLEIIDPDDVFSDSEDIVTESTINSLVVGHDSDNKNSVIYQKPCPRSKKKVEIESAITVSEEHDSDNGSPRTYKKPPLKSKKKAVHFNISNENRSKDVQTRVDDDDDGHICKICSKTFKSSFSLDIHITSHSEDRPFPCTSENCGKYFKNIKALRQHDVAVHRNQNKMTKSISKFDNENENKPKLPSSATKEKNSQLVKKGRPTCSICGKEFRNNHDLNVHASSHSEERPFSCQDCEKTFKNTKALQQHRAVHERKLTFECKECPAKFGLKTELTYHSRIHLGIPLFECEICHKQFRRKTHLNIHELTHTNFTEALQLNNPSISFNATPKLFNNESTNSSNNVKKEVNTKMLDFRKNSEDEDFSPSTSNQDGYFHDTLPIEVKITKTEGALNIKNVDIEVKEEIFDGQDSPEGCYDDFGNSDYTVYPPTPLPDSESEPLNLPYPSPQVEAEVDSNTDTEWLPSRKKRKKRSAVEIPNPGEEQSSEPIKSLRGRVITTVEPESADEDDSMSSHSSDKLISESNKKRKRGKRQITKNDKNDRPTEYPHFKCQCPICSKVFHQRKEISSHQIEKYGGILLFECGVCFCRYLALDNLIEHEACHKEEQFQEKGKSSELYKEKLAASKDNNLDELKQLLLKPENEAYKCSLCSMVLRGNRYNQHITTTHLRCFVCSFCGKAIKSQAFLDNHIAEHHLGEKNHLCSVCGKGYATVKRLTEHNIRVHASAGKFYCDHCGKVFKTKLYLTRHLEVIHADADKKDRKYKCHLCPKAFYARSTLSSHAKFHNPEMKKIRNAYFRGRKHLNLECPKCLCKFSTQATLKKHNENVHATDVPEKLKKYLRQNRRPKNRGENKNQDNVNKNPANVTCEICGYIAKYPSLLIVHKDIHRSDRPYTCEICGKTFKTRYNLSDHKSTHKTTLDAICDVCDLPLRKKDLNKHKLQAHGSGISCEICGKLFSTAKLLKQHSAVHLSDEDKPFQCEICSKKYSLTQHLHQHLRNHHKIAPQTRITARTQIPVLAGQHQYRYPS